MKRNFAIICLAIPLWLFSQQPQVDSLHILLDQKQGTERIDILNDLAFHYYTISPDSGVSYAQQALSLAKELEYQKGVATALQNMGVNYLELGKLKEAFENNKQALSIFEKLQDPTGICESLINIGLVYNEFGQNDKAMDYMCRMMEIAEEHQDTVRIIKGYINKSKILEDTGDHSTSLEYLKKAEELSEYANDYVNLAIIYLNQSVNFSRSKDYKKAQKYLEKAEAICRETGNNSTLLFCYLNIGVNYQQQGNVERAMEYYNRGLELSDKLGDKSRAVLLNYNIGMLYLGQGRYREAESYLSKTLNLATENETRLDLLYAYWGLSSFYEATHKYKQSLEYIKKYDEVANELFSDNSQKRISAIQAAYEVRKKDREMELLKQEQQIQAMKLERQHFYLLVLIIGILIIIGASLIVLRLYNKQRIANRELYLASEKILDNEKKLKRINRDQEKLLKDLEEANITKDKFFSIVAHDIKSPLQVQLSGSRLLSDRIDSLDKEKIRDIAKELKKNTLHLFDLLENLLNWSRLQQGRMEHNPQRIHLSEMVNSVVGLMGANANQKNISLETDVIDNIYIEADPNMIKSVLQNVISNGIKFSDPGTAIQVTARENGQYINVRVEDAGIGIPDDLHKDLFRIDKQGSRTGTQGEKGTGLGLVLCRDFMEKNNGSISVHSKEGAGTTVTLKFPKLKLSQ